MACRLATPSHYLNQCWDIANWTHRNKFHWSIKQNSYIFILKNAFENVVWKMGAILSWPQCVKTKTVMDVWADKWMRNTHMDRIMSISWWHHQMEIIFCVTGLFAGNSPVTSEFPHKGQWHRALMCSLICSWTNSWVNTPYAGDLRCHGTHYDVTEIMNTWGQKIIKVNSLWPSDAI